jgi:hypothetical protein
MLLLRLIFFVVLIAIGGGLTMYFFSRDRRYLRFVWRATQVTLLVVLAILLFHAAKRLLSA